MNWRNNMEKSDSSSQNDWLRLTAIRTLDLFFRWGLTWSGTSSCPSTVVQYPVSLTRGKHTSKQGIPKTSNKWSIHRIPIENEEFEAFWSLNAHVRIVWLTLIAAKVFHKNAKALCSHTDSEPKLETSPKAENVIFGTLNSWMLLNYPQFRFER